MFNIFNSELPIPGSIFWCVQHLKRAPAWQWFFARWDGSRNKIWRHIALRRTPPPPTPRQQGCNNRQYNELLTVILNSEFRILNSELIILNSEFLILNAELRTINLGFLNAELGNMNSGLGILGGHYFVHL